MIAEALSALLLAAQPELEGGVFAGAGYDSDVNHADASAAPIGSGFGALRANGGVSLDLGDTTNLYGGVRFDDEEYPSYSDLTTRSAGGEVSLVQALGRHVAIVVTPWGSRSWSGDSARDATTLAAQATLRWRPVANVALRGSYAYTSRTADDPVFSSDRNRVAASVEWRVRRRTYLSLAASWEQGDEVFYRSTAIGSSPPSNPGAGMGRMGGNGNGGFYAQEPYKALATTRAVGPALELGLDRTFHLAASAEARFVRSDAADIQTWSVFLGVGARL